MGTAKKSNLETGTLENRKRFRARCGPLNFDCFFSGHLYLGVWHQSTGYF